MNISTKDTADIIFHDANHFDIGQWNTKRAVVPLMTHPAVRATQSKVGIHMESSVFHPYVGAPEWRAMFDLTLGLNPAHVDWKTSYQLRSVALVQTPPVPFEQKTGIVFFMHGNCAATAFSAFRNAYVEELMKYIQVDAYGRCLKNKEFPIPDTGVFSPDSLVRIS